MLGRHGKDIDNNSNHNCKSMNNRNHRNNHSTRGNIPKTEANLMYLGACSLKALSSAPRLFSLETLQFFKPKNTSS